MTTSPTVSRAGRGEAVTDPDEGLLADVVVMTEQAAVDGLPLASVFADLRLVLGLEEADELPPAVVRRCAVTWSQAQAGPDRSGQDPVSWEELEGRWWPVLAGPVDELPGWVLLVEPPAAPEQPALLTPEDVLLGAAELLLARLAGAGDRVALLDGGDGGPGAVLALVAGDAVRAERVAGWVRQLAPGSAGPRVTLRPLSDEPAGAWAAIRELARGLG